MLTTASTAAAVNERMAGFKRHCTRLTRHVFSPLYALEWRLKLQAHKPLIAGERFTVRLAASAREVRKAQRLRHDIFIAEQGHGSAGQDSGLDRDEYDDTSLHLLVEENATKQIVGTYRVRPGHLVRKSPGWYSARQYEISGLAEIEHELCEVGRSCVSPEFRGGTVVVLLWAGLLELMARMGCRYMIGCASLESRDAAAGWALYRHFKETGKVSAQIAGFPRPEFRLSRPEASGEPLSERELRKLMPPLLKGYLRLGAEIGGLPSYDPEFDSIDFMIVFDIQKIDHRYQKHFGC